VRRSARFGAGLGGLDTGSKVLARAGVLKGAATTIHWKNRVTFFEEHPDEVLTGDVYTADQGRYATAGGTASIDLALHLVTELCGEDIAHQIAVRMNYTNIRVLQNSEKIHAADQVGFRHPKLSIIISLMETNLEEPLKPADLARSVNISARQLERLFRRYLKTTPSSYYTVMRLGHARNLLLQSDMYIAEIAAACGFGSASHFSRRFRGHFGYSPYKLRFKEQAC
jgi:transcriptional regulator GlxA family with amidase domain